MRPARAVRYAIGIGCRSGVRPEAVRALLERVVTGHRLDLGAAVFSTVATRAAEPGLLAALRSLVREAQLVAWSAAELAEEPVPNSSERVAAAAGTPSVAEAAALRTARTLPGATGAELVVHKVVGDGVTLAVATSL